MKKNACQIAVGLLSRRDHSEKELRQKLLVRQLDQKDIELAIAYCHEHAWISDVRIAQSLLQQALRKGYGWQRVCLNAKEKGIDLALIKSAQAESKVDWFAHAKAVAIKRFADIDGNIPSVDNKTRAKWMRFLQYRGFSSEQIKFALSS